MVEHDLDGNPLRDVWNANTKMPPHIGEIWMKYFRSEQLKQQEEKHDNQ